jgi:hypothetical protein
VIKTFIIDAPTLLLIGFIFSWLNREELNGAEMLRSKMFTRGIILCTIFIIAALWSYVLSPDWMWMYYPTNAETPLLGIVYILVFMYYIHFAFGYILGIWLERKKKHLSWAGAAVALVLNIIIMVLTYERYAVVGTYEQFHNGTAIPLTDPSNAVALPMNIAPVVMIIFAIAILIPWWKEGKALKAAS